jgi:hypothetical protein
MLRRRWADPISIAVATGALVLAFDDPRRADAQFASDCAAPTQTFGAGNMPTDLNISAGDVILFIDGTFAGNVNSNVGRMRRHCRHVQPVDHQRGGRAVRAGKRP